MQSNTKFLVGMLALFSAFVGFNAYKDRSSGRGASLHGDGSLSRAHSLSCRQGDGGRPTGTSYADACAERPGNPKRRKAQNGMASSSAGNDRHGKNTRRQAMARRRANQWWRRQFLRRAMDIHRISKEVVEKADVSWRWNPPKVDTSTPEGRLVLACWRKEYEFGPARLDEGLRQSLAARIIQETANYNSDPEGPAAQKLANLYFRYRKFEKALYFAEKAHSLQPLAPAPLLAMIDVYRVFGMGRKLQETWDKLLEINPGSSEYGREKIEDFQRFGDFYAIGESPIKAVVELDR